MAPSDLPPTSVDLESIRRNPRGGEAIEVIRTLRGAGFAGVLAGGCVRDALLARPAKDFDVATDATPDAIRELFGRRRTLAFGASFGVIGVLPSSGGGVDRVATEVATFRSDGAYTDGRRPDSVQFGNARDDAQRRDFTINGLFYDPIDDRVLDYVGGRGDLRRGILRTIGSAADRFAEDKLRLLRAVRFATTLGFEIEAETLSAIRQTAATIHVVSGERIGAEMRRVMTDPAAAEGLTWLERTGLMPDVLPEAEGVDRGRFHRMHRSQVESPSFTAAMACLLLLASDECRSPSAMVKAIVDRWRLSGEEGRRIRFAATHADTLIAADSLPWSRVQPIVVDRDGAIAFEVARRLAIGSGAPLAGLNAIMRRRDGPAGAFDPPPLIDGGDLRTMGLKPGPAFREILGKIRDQQLDGKLVDRAAAIAWVNEWIRER